MASFPLPQNEHDQKVIMDAIKEISGAKTREQGEKDYISETVKDLSKKYQIPVKMIKKFAKDYHNSEFTKTVDETNEYEELVAVLQPKALNQFKD